MKRLNRSILEDYEVALNAPSRVCAVQFGDDALLLGLVDRLLDDANASGMDVGVAVVQPGEAGFARDLAEQDGLFTAFVRGEQGDKPVNREQVVQSVLTALNPAADDAALMALARDGGVRFAILHEDEIGEFAERDRLCMALAARFLVERWRAGLDGMALIVCGGDVGCGERLRARIAGLARGWNADGFGAWLDGCRFFPALADCLVSRSGAEEAARLCAEMNYADAMIHLAEPYGLWAIQADDAFCEEFPLADHCARIEFTDDLAPYFLRKQRLFDAGLFALAALGLLHGNETLSECMKDEPLRDLVGHALYDEILPYVPFDREQIIPYVIACCERYANPMNENRITDCARGLIHKFNTGILPVIRAYSDETFELPKHLVVALAATIMVYADARPRDGGYETVIGQTSCRIHESDETLASFTRLASDMSPDSLAYAVLSDRDLWNGADLRDIDGLLDAVTDNIAG